MKEKLAEEAQSVLSLLVELHKYKTAHGKDDFYEMRKVVAWERAYRWLDAKEASIGGDEVTVDSLRNDLEDKRITKIMEDLDEKKSSSYQPDKTPTFKILYYLSLKHAAEALLDKYKISPLTKGEG